MTLSRIVSVDETRCTGCGLCLRVCPRQALKREGGTVRFVARSCLACGHCAAVCPEQAITVPALWAEAQQYENLAAPDRWLAPGECDAAALVQLMRSRRSCRNYRQTPVPRPLLEDLVKIGITAPSGTNSQRWTFTLLPDRDAVTAFAGEVATFFRRLNAMAGKAWLRALMRLIGKPELSAYYRDHYASVSRALQDYAERGEDRLFHGATAAILVGMKPGASCPMEDALLATQNILLGAHCLGLGSCLIGYAVAAIAHQPALKAVLRIPREETVFSVIALGYADERYASPAGRLAPPIRYWEGR